MFDGGTAPRHERNFRGHARSIATQVDIDALRGLLPARIARPSAASDDGAWLLLLVAGRLAATAIGAALVAWAGFRELDSLLLLYGPLSAFALVVLPGLRRAPVTWAADYAPTLFFVVLSEDWRSPFYLLWLSSLALPATGLPIRRALWLATGSAVAYLAVAVIGGPVPGRLQLVSTETLAIHVSLPVHALVSRWPTRPRRCAAYRRALRARAARDRGRTQADRVRAARLGQAAAARRAPARDLAAGARARPAGTDRRARRIELESAASDMDTSLAELRSPLEGRRLDAALRAARRASSRTPTARASPSTATRPTSHRSSARTRTGSPARR